MDFSLPQRLVQAHLPHAPLPQKSMNEKELWVLHFVCFSFVAKFHHHLMTKKKQEKNLKIGVEEHTHTHSGCYFFTKGFCCWPCCLLTKGLDVILSLAKGNDIVF